jgi:ATP-dependent Clp protease ATP-binding subunit ClpC
MFERYTENARRVIFSSTQKAALVGSPEIDTEHLLLGLLSTDKGLAQRFLGSPWAAEAIWRRIEPSKPVRQRVEGRVDIPLSGVSKRVLFCAMEEADRLSSQHIGTEHLLLGLLREENCLAAELLNEGGVRLASAREELMRTPHTYSATEAFVRERGPLPDDVVELQTRIESIFRRVEEAIAQGDFAKAREYSEEEGRERERLRLLYQQHGLPDWLYD